MHRPHRDDDFDGDGHVNGIPNNDSCPFQTIYICYYRWLVPTNARACVELYNAGRLTMDEASIVAQISQTLIVFMIWVLPPLIAAVIVGLGIGIIQAATQIQDETLHLTVKLLVVVAILALFAPVLTAPLIEQADYVFSQFPAIIPSH
ncbi:putative translocation protein y4yM (modular protein) [Mesorhizobium sp. ORS 3324]|nr:putative translocation protein y4yM (modular protein) [Mesorhizobium sp. ORS 3324]